MILSASTHDNNPSHTATVHGCTVRVSADGTRVELNALGDWCELRQIEDMFGKGYLRVRLPGGKTIAVHKLVALAWHGPSPTPAHVLVEHLDGSRRHNHKDNVRWATHSDNLNSALRLRERERKYPVKLNESIVYAIRTRRHRSEIATLADEHNAGEQTVRDVFDGHTWKHVRTDQGRIDGTL